MALTVVAPGTATALCLVSSLKRELNLALRSLPPGTDETLADMVLDASGAVERYCGRVFAAAQYQELLAGNDSAQLLLSRTPIITIDAVLFQSEPLLDVTVADADAGLVYRERGFGWTGTYAWGTLSDSRAPGSERPLYAITYTAGYRLPGDSATVDPLSPRPADGAPELPRDLQRAALETAKAYWEGRSGVLIKSKSVADLSVSYGDVPLGDLPAAVKTLLTPYRRAI